MPNPMDVAKVLPTVERAAGVSFADVMKGEGMVGRAISGLFDSSPLTGVAKQLDGFGINWIGVERAGQGIEKMSPANTTLASTRSDSMLLKPLHEADRFVFGTRAFGNGHAELINVHKTMATMVHNEGVLSKGTEIAPNTARFVDFMKYRGVERASTFDGFQRAARGMRGLFGDADQARSMAAQYAHRFSARPSFTHSHYIREKPGILGPLENPIRTDLADIRRYKSGATDVWPLKHSGDKSPNVAVKYDARLRQIT